MYYFKRFSIIIIAVLTTVTDGERVLGKSSCLYYGSVNESCGLKKVPITNLPQECTSFVFANIISNDNFRISDGSNITGNGEYLKDVTASSKPAFVLYGHPTVEQWITVLSGINQNNSDKAKTEMNNLKAYLGNYDNLSGLIIENLEYSSESKNFSDFTASFTIYLDVMRSTFPDYGIGVSFIGAEFIDYYKSRKSSLEWLDFKVLDSKIDFYVLNVYDFNNCTDEFRNGGTVPVDGDAQYTLTKLAEYAKEANIPVSKIYFQFNLGTKSSVQDATYCDSSNTKRCARSSLDDLCVDNTKSFYEKGKFVKNNGAGFIGMDLDLIDDPHDECKCEKKYPAFHDILAGLNEIAIPASCPLFDKNLK